MEYTQDELGKLFDSLPIELKDAIMSEENADRIRQICERYGIEENSIPKIAKMVGRILLGVLPPKELPLRLNEELLMPTDKSNNVSREVNRFILFPVKDILAKIYEGLQFAPGGRLIEKKSAGQTAEEQGKAGKTEAEAETLEDTYREPVGPAE